MALRRTLRSSPGRGTAFRVLIPASSDPVDAEGTIAVLDSAVCADRCRYEGCATAPPISCGLGAELVVLLPLLAGLRDV